MLGLLTKVWRDLLNRPLRSLLTIFGIAVGVGGMVAITSTARNVVRAQREVFASTSQADIRYWVWEAPTSLVRSLEADERIAAAELRLTYTTRWRARGSWMDIELIGIDDFERITVNQFEILQGRAPSVGEALLELSASSMADLSPGTEIAYRDAFGRERYLTVSGISLSPGNLSSAITKIAIAYVPGDFLRNVMGVSGSNQLLIKLHDPRQAQSVAQRVTRLLQRQGIQAGTPELRDVDRFAGKRELDALIVIMFIFSGMGLLLGSLLVMNTLSAIVAEQIGEIGALKSFGATRAQILILYLLESCAYGLAGTLLGLVAGAVGGWRLLVWIGSLGSTKVGFRLAPESLAMGLGVGIVVALVGGLAPALEGARISVKQALSSYGIRADYGQGWLDRGLKRLGRLPPLLAMAVRNLSRRPVRSGLTLLVVALSAAAFLSALAMRDSVNSAIADIYQTYYADAWVWFDQLVSTQFEGLFPSVDGVYTAEGWLIADGHVGLSEARLWGLPAQSALYREVMREGRWFDAHEPDAVVLSAELADKRRLRVGDTIEIQTRGRSRFFRVVGVAIDNTIFLGGQLAGKAFLSRDVLSAMLGHEDMANLFALGLTSRDRQAADATLARVEFKFQRWRPVVQPIYVEIEAACEASRLLTLGLLAMVIIVALVGALGMVNTLALNVLERRREIAILRTLGGTDAAVLLAFLGEGLVYGCLGLVLGLAIGYPLARLFTARLSQALFELGFVLSPWAITGNVMFTLVWALAASLGPALGAARTATHVALRYE